jgi:hypothetical protein
MRSFFGLLLFYGLVFQAAAEEQPLISPTVYLFGVYGTSSAEHPGDFTPGGHDPSRKDAFILQAAEPSLSLRWGNHVQGFVNGLAYTDAEDNIEWEWEEYFLKLTDLPGGIELRGGRMLSRLGFHNATHLHSWGTVDAPLVHSLFLGEDGLALEGGELSLYLATEQPSVLSFGFGQRPSHDHAHAHGDDHAEDDHADHDHAEDEHDHSDFGAFEPYRVLDDVFTVGFRRENGFNDFHKLSLAAFGGIGDNEVGSSSWFAGAGVEYQWRENGFEPGGRALRWRTEAIRFFSDAGAHDDHDHEEDHDDDHDEDHHDDHADEHAEEDHDHEEVLSSVSSWGLTTELTYEANERVHPFVRLDYVASTEALDLSDWIRYSAGMTIHLHDEPGLFLRLQGNADERGDESEQSLWAQIGMSWGGGEVR